MIYFANPSTEAIRDAIAVGKIGCIITPHQGNVTFPDEWDTIADNGCFSHRWTEEHWFRWLLALPRTVRFVVCPDVFDPTLPTHDETVERWATYGPRIECHGFVPAFVAQVGCIPATIPPDVSVLFIGGTTEWKLGPIASACVREMKQRGRWVHMGRVNSLRRYEAARAMGCDSADGTFLTFGPDVNLPRLLSWTNEPQGMLDLAG